MEKKKKEEKGIEEKKPDALGQRSLSQIVMGSWDSGESLIVLSLQSLHVCSKPRLCTQTMTVFEFNFIIYFKLACRVILCDTECLRSLLMPPQKCHSLVSSQRRYWSVIFGVSRPGFIQCFMSSSEFAVPECWLYYSRWGSDRDPAQYNLPGQ